MSLEAEFLELNGAYQNTVATNLDLRERCAELETLVKEYQNVAAELLTHVSIGGKRVKKFEELQQRAKELLS